MKTCPECQEQVRDAARICRECGHLFPAEPPSLPTRTQAPPRRRPSLGRRAVGWVSANAWKTATLALLALLVASIVLGNVGGGGDAKAKPRTLAVSLEKKFSAQLDRVEQDLRPVMSEQGAEGTAYRVEEGSTSCREEDESPSYLCLVWLVDGEGTRFSLAYSLTSSEGACWEASPERAQLTDGRPIPIDPAKLPPLDYCLSSSAQQGEAGPACDPSYPDFCIPPPPPDRNCPDLSQTDFTVKTVEGDPHGFDSDADGVGCEQPTPEPPEAPTEAKGPTGVLGTSSVGPVTVGMPSEQVEALFGPPERKEEVNFGQGPAPQIDWIWNFEDGEFRLQFETQGGTVTGYVSNTAELATKSGVSVGDSFDLIRDEYGDQLEESVIGEGSYLLSDGEPGTHPALTFSVEGDTIVSISGGEFQPAGE